MWPLFKVWISTVATSNLLGVDTCSPNEETEIFSWWVGWSCSWLASSWVMKECWAPSSNKMWPSTAVSLADTFSMAVLSKHTLLEKVLSDVELAAASCSCVSSSSFWILRSCLFLGCLNSRNWLILSSLKLRSCLTLRNCGGRSVGR